ncbi:MAG: hypothetical protein ABIG89_03525 [Candidatus Woesearchaeota archaeon]
MANTNKIKLGLFLPAKDPNQPSSIEYPGYVDQNTRDSLVERLKMDSDIEVFDGVDFRNAIVVNGDVLLGDMCLNDLDFFFWHAEIDRYPTSYHIEILETLADDCVVVNNPSALKIGLDKYLAHTKLRRAGLSVSDFASFPNDLHSYKLMKKYLAEWGSMLIKPRLGAFGHGIIKVDDFSTLRDVVGYTRTLDSGRVDAQGSKTIFVERFYPNDHDEWCSMTILGGELAYGYRKRPEKFHGWKVYDEDRIGGCVDYILPSDEHRELALRAKDALGLDIIGFDIIKTQPEGRLIIVDENTNPGFYKDIFRQAGIDPADVLYKYIRQHILYFKESFIYN